jgi:hypothetical protein
MADLGTRWMTAVIARAGERQFAPTIARREDLLAKCPLCFRKQPTCMHRGDTPLRAKSGCEQVQ